MDKLAQIEIGSQLVLPKRHCNCCGELMSIKNVEDAGDYFGYTESGEKRYRVIIKCTKSKWFNSHNEVVMYQTLNGKDRIFISG